MRLFVFSVYRGWGGLVYPLKYRYIFIDIFYMLILSIKIKAFFYLKNKSKNIFICDFLVWGGNFAQNIYFAKC